MNRSGNKTAIEQKQTDELFLCQYGFGCLLYKCVNCATIYTAIVQILRDDFQYFSFFLQHCSNRRKYCSYSVLGQRHSNRERVEQVRDRNVGFTCMHDRPLPVKLVSLPKNEQTEKQKKTSTVILSHCRQQFKVVVFTNT